MVDMLEDEEVVDVELEAVKEVVIEVLVVVK